MKQTPRLREVLKQKLSIVFNEWILTTFIVFYIFEYKYYIYYIHAYMYLWVIKWKHNNESEYTWIKLKTNMNVKWKSFLCNYRIAHEDSYNAKLTAMTQDFTWWWILIKRCSIRSEWVNFIVITSMILYIEKVYWKSNNYLHNIN